jgi:hypothetical protein
MPNYKKSNFLFIFLKNRVKLSFFGFTIEDFMNIFEYNDYRQVLEEALELSPVGSKHGMIGRLARHIKVHSTFISQVRRGMSHLSMDQSIGVCSFFRFRPDETDFFLDLVALARCGSKEGRLFFRERIDRCRNGRSDVQNRLAHKKILSRELAAVYYQTWVHQAVHMLAQCDGGTSSEEVVQQLRISSAVASRVIDQLIECDILEKKNLRLTTRIPFLHLVKGTPEVTHVHANWRAKILQEIQSPSDANAFHFSSAIALDQRTAKAIHQILLDSIATISASVDKAEAKKVSVLCMDFISLTSDS